MWEDITDIIHAAASALKDAAYAKSPMLAVEDFSLFEAMSATELFDEKMDPGCNMTGIIEESSILRPDLKPLSPMMVLSTLKKLFILEIAFYDGASILESTHQCIFLWPASWEHLLLSSLDSSDVKDSLLLRFLCAYCAQLLQTMGFVHKLVLDADIYQDEDFQPLSKPSLEAVSIPSFVPSVSILVTELEANIETNPHPSFLLQLFQFRMAHHNMTILLSDLVSFCLRQFSTLHLFGEISAYEEAVASVKGMIKQLTKAIHDLLSLLPSWTTLFESVNEESSCDDLNDIVFSKNLARISQSNPLRSISFLTISESITTLKAILTQMLGVIDMNLPCIDLLVLKGLPSFETIFHSSIDLCSRRYHLQARCLHHALLHIYRPKLPELIRISMTQRGFVDVMIHTPNTFAWIEQNFTYTAWETLKRLSVHQNCLLPKLELLLSKWAVLTREAAVLDQQFRSLHSLQDDAFSVHVYWTMLLVSQLMDACMSLMMQTQLVTPPELPSFFWYWDYILTSRATAMQHLREYKQAINSALTNEATTSNQKKSRASSGTATSAASLSVITIHVEENMTRGAGQLCRALFRLSVVMSELGLVQKQSDPSQLAFTTWEMRFFQRFRLFSEITSPPPLPYTDFEAMLRGSFEITELLSAASFCFKKAKGFIDDAKKSGASKDEGNENSFTHEALMLERATALLKTIVAGNVNIMRLSSDKILLERHKEEASAAGQVGMRKGGDGENKPKRRSLLVDFPYCNSFPVLSIAD